MKFPNEGKAYRAARNRLLAAEKALRRKVESVAALRRALPPGGRLPQDYVFEEGEPVRKVRLSALFGRFDTLIAYSFMYGPKMQKACPMCTAMLDSLNGSAPHITQRASLVVVGASPVPRLREFARSRGWSNLRLVSSQGNCYNTDYFGESPDGGQMPMLNVFIRRSGVVRHFWGTELLGAKAEPGQHPRHVDMLWPLWNAFDLMPDGRGRDWFPQLDYRG